MNFAQFQTTERRLALLQGLNASLQCRSSALLLRHYCDAVGQTTSVGRIEQDLAWLRERGLVSVTASEGQTEATLTPLGQDVAVGRDAVAGVARPQPQG